MSVLRPWHVALALMLAPLLALSAACQKQPPPAAPPVVQPNSLEVHFSPKGGCTEAVVRELAAAKGSVCVQAYSFTSEPIAKALLEARNRGLNIEVVLDRSNRTDKYSAATFLLNQGIDVRIDDRHAIAHNKVIILDGRTVLTGSFNFTKQAEESNAENLLIIHECPALAESYLANFREHQAHSQPYTGLLKAEAPMDPAAAKAVPARYISKRGSGIYHVASCKDAAKINPIDREEYDQPPPGKRLHTGCPK